MPRLDGDVAIRSTLPTVLCLAAFLFSTTGLFPGAAGDTLAAGASIRLNENLTSSQGSFVLGFFTPRPNHTYLGIWYKRIPVQTVVWVANRQRPQTGSNGSLAMSRDGTLILADATGVIWSTGPNLGLSSPVARLLDTGNLVILDQRGGSHVWESFANPGNTMLPGMQLGMNRRTGEMYNLTGWRAPDDPAPGGITWCLDPRGVPQMFVLNGSARLWRGGPWFGDRFTGIPMMRDNNLFYYGFISNADALYFQYNNFDQSMVTRITVNQLGAAEHLMWNDTSRSWELLWASVNETCDRLAACGNNGLCDSSSSPMCGCLEGFELQPPPQRGQRGATAGAVCERKEPLRCPNGEDDFVLVSGTKLPDTSAATDVPSMGFDDCRERCLRNCSCTAFASRDGGRCITWFGELTDVILYGSGGHDLYVRVASKGGMNKKKVILIITLLITFVGILLLVLIWLCRRRQMNRKRLKDMQQTMEEWQGEDGDHGNDFELQLFTFSTLESATDHFSFQNKLGEGGYGPVYKGKLHDGQWVAIKRLSKDSTQGLEQFKSEVQLVAKLQHTNLVRLLGCCIQSEEKILVYEYMSNQSLDRFIFDANRGRQLDWAKRLHIIEGITQGLLYLHKYSRLRVIHRDLKASNILLDDEWNPKIADFGLARIFNWNESEVNTKRIIGTYGYMPPEYAMKGLFSIKSDVFSFGVLLLEILSGKRNSSINDFGISRNLPGRAWELWREGRDLELKDPVMDGLVPRNQFSRCIHVALLCVQENPIDRPTMLDIVTMLNSETTSLPTPYQPAFFFVRHTTEEGNNPELEHFSSSNSVTLTRVEGR